MMNKRGQELSTNAIIMIVIGVIVLVVLVLGFTIGWGRLLPFVSTNNIENIKTACSTSCATSNSYDFCTLPREIKDGVNEPFNSNCYDLVKDEILASRNYGITNCSAIACGR